MNNRLSPPLEISVLKRRSDFVRIQKDGRRWVTPGFVVACESSDSQLPDSHLPAPVTVGLTITKKIGNAVVRNRIRRRFRHMMRDILPHQSNLAGWRIVLLARHDALTRDYAVLGKDLRWALRKIQEQITQDAKARAETEANTQTDIQTDIKANTPAGARMNAKINNQATGSDAA